MRHPPALLLTLTLCAPIGPAQAADPARGAQPATRPSVTAPAAPRDLVRVATYNVENWRTHFETFRNKGQRLTDEAARDQRDREREQNDEDNWEIAQVFLDPTFAPDVVVLQEGPAQAELEEFNRRWLRGAYETILVFPSNDDRGQTIGVMLKPGFRVVERQDQYHTMPDPTDLNPRTEYLFARGPAFVLVEAPGGKRFWVGTNHQKSKGGGNDVAMTRWRLAEAQATQRIVKELAARGGAAGVVFLGDMNDELGFQSYELEAGADVTTALVGPPADGFRLVTRPLAEAGQASFMGYWNDQHRSFIDHAVVTPGLAGAVTNVGVYDSPWARVASDHLPVFVDLKLAN